MRKIFKIASVILLTTFAASLHAYALEQPRGTPILEITGNIQESNTAQGAVFDRDMLEAVGIQAVVTSTPWDNGQVRFEGVPLAALLELVKASGDTVRVTALNDYVSLVPISDFKKYGVILALKKNGEYMSIREKGPLFIVYPFDSDPSLKAQTFYARSVWQVKSMAVE